MVYSDPAKCGLDCGARVDGYDYQNKDDISLQLRSLSFFQRSIS